MIDEKAVRQIARLARLGLNKDETALFSCQLGSIVAHFDRLREVDTSGVKPFFYFAAGFDLLREDRPAPSLPGTRALENAPQEEVGHFRVPPTFEREE